MSFIPGLQSGETTSSVWLVSKPSHSVLGSTASLLVLRWDHTALSQQGQYLCLQVPGLFLCIFVMGSPLVGHGLKLKVHFTLRCHQIPISPWDTIRHLWVATRLGAIPDVFPLYSILSWGNFTFELDPNERQILSQIDLGFKFSLCLPTVGIVWSRILVLTSLTSIQQPRGNCNTCNTSESITGSLEPYSPGFLPKLLGLLA